MGSLDAVPPPLSGRVVNSFAYLTIKDRLPIILTKVIDDLCRERKNFIDNMGVDAGDEVAEIVGAISKLKYQMQTDKPLSLFEDDFHDAATWNHLITDVASKESPSFSSSILPTWFSTPWLFVECYMYRRVFAAFFAVSHLKEVDPFVTGKTNALVSARASIVVLAKRLKEILGDDRDRSVSSSPPPPRNNDSPPSLSAKEEFGRRRRWCEELFHLCLWGNKCDLSISSGSANRGGFDSSGGDRVDQVLEKWKDKILVDDFEALWKLLTMNMTGDYGGSGGGLVVEWVLDNAGFEFFTDLLLAEFLTETGLVSKIRFHVKRIPWFVSDVTPRDVDLTLQWMTSMSSSATDVNDYDEDDVEAVVRHLGAKWQSRFHASPASSWTVEAHEFWTLPTDFRLGMRQSAPDLFADLRAADLVIFKGDLNYRKLVGDLAWPPTTPFAVALGDLATSLSVDVRPTRVLALRTLKADVVTGLEEGVAEKLCEEWNGNDWMTNGQYGLIQLA